jgi:hypothetical protein
MMNVIEIQDKLKNFSQDQLIGEMQNPTGNAPQFLVLSEITRRQKMVNDDKIRQAKQNEMTVAQEAVAAAGVPQDGIAGMARAMAPKTDIAQNTGVMVPGANLRLWSQDNFGENLVFNVRSGAVYIRPNRSIL